jgi:hypothetical protein
MYNSDNRPLGPLSETAYEMLCETIDSGDGIRFDDAVARLSATEFTLADAEYALEQLINRGYLYRVDGELFITERVDESEDSETES